MVVSSDPSALAVPDGGSTLALLGLAFVGIAAATRVLRRRRKAPALKASRGE